MVKRLLFSLLFVGMYAAGTGCGGTDDESRLMPTPTQGPPTPTPLPICRGLEVPAGGLGCRPFTWTQPVASNTSGSQLFTTLPSNTGFDFLPSLVGNSLDPGGNFIDLPPGMALIAGVPDEDGIAEVRIGVTEENQLDPGFFVIGMKPLLDYICLKIELATVDGKLYCNGSDSEGIDTRTTAESGITPPEDDVIEIGLGDSVEPGGLLLRVIQRQGRISQGGNPRYETCFELPDCEPGQRFDCYRPPFEIGYTTGTVFGMKGDTPLLAGPQGPEGLSGEPFECGTAWTTENGPGQLVYGITDFDLIGGDVASAFRIDD